VVFGRIARPGVPGQGEPQSKGDSKLPHASTTGLTVVWSSAQREYNR